MRPVIARSRSVPADVAVLGFGPAAFALGAELDVLTLLIMVITAPAETDARRFTGEV
jgi:hypothetical protein